MNDDDTPQWDIDIAALKARGDLPPPPFTVGEEVELHNPPHWAPGFRLVTITSMNLCSDGRIQCSWVANDTSIGSAPEYAFHKVRTRE